MRRARQGRPKGNPVYYARLEGRTLARVLALMAQSGRSAQELVDMAIGLFEIATRDVHLLRGAPKAAAKSPLVDRSRVDNSGAGSLAGCVRQAVARVEAHRCVDPPRYG